MKAAIIFIFGLVWSLTFTHHAQARGDGFFPFDWQNGQWETVQGQYSVQFRPSAHQPGHLNVYLFGWNKRQPLLWGVISADTRNAMLVGNFVDSQGGQWKGVIYRSYLGLHLYLNNGPEEIGFELFDKREEVAIGYDELP